MPCVYCQDHRPHPLYLYLLSDRRRGGAGIPFVGLTAHPFARLCGHNRVGARFGRGDPLTRSGAGYYQMELIFGPLWVPTPRLRRKAGELMHRCRRESRKLISRMVKFHALARTWRHPVQFPPRLFARDVAVFQRLVQFGRP